MNDELRDRFAHAYYRRLWRRDNWEQMSERQRWPYYEVADVMLARLNAAGLTIVRVEGCGE